MDIELKLDLKYLISKIREHITGICDCFDNTDKKMAFSDLCELSSALGFYKKKIDYFIDEFF